MDEKELIDRIKKGDESAFDILYHDYSSMVYNVALSYSKNTADAEEITQEVFVKIYKNVNSFNLNSTIKTWVYRITINESLNFIKKRDRLISFKSLYQNKTSESFFHPGVLEEKKDKSGILFKAIDCLSSNQKTAFILFYIDNLSQKEIAEIMENTVKGVESLLQRAKKKLRAELDNSKKYRRN